MRGEYAAARSCQAAGRRLKTLRTRRPAAFLQAHLAAAKLALALVFLALAAAMALGRFGVTG